MLKIGQMNKIANAKYSLIISTHHSPASARPTLSLDCSVVVLTLSHLITLPVQQKRWVEKCHEILG